LRSEHLSDFGAESATAKSRERHDILIEHGDKTFHFARFERTLSRKSQGVWR
jgi:hypothetical protein